MERHRPPHVLTRYDVLNMLWPSDPAAFWRHDKSITVRVRIVWDRDGEEYVEGVATLWDANHIYVEVRDKLARQRCMGQAL